MNIEDNRLDILARSSALRVLLDCLRNKGWWGRLACAAALLSRSVTIDKGRRQE